MSHAGLFALGNFEKAGRAFPGLIVQEQVFDLTSVADQFGLPRSLTTRDLLLAWDKVFPQLLQLADRVADRDRDRDRDNIWNIEQLTVLAPVQPSQVLQSGANYRQHVIDLAVAHTDIARGRSAEEVRAETASLMDVRAVEGVPYMFIGLPSAVAGPYDDLTLPSYSTKNDWELELAAVIGRPGFRLDRATALDHVAGYTIVNDITSRDLVFRKDMPEIGTDWFRGKNAPGFLPTGPFLVPAAFVGDLSDLRVTLELNGQVMQDETTKDMIFDVAALVAAASQITPLLPGDLILTGSPAGNGIHWGRLLQPGDVMEGRVTGLGSQRITCRAEVTT